MKLALIQDCLSQYKAYLSETKNDDQVFKWAVLKNFEDHWNIETDHISDMYSKCLQSDASRNLWGGNRDSAKSVMLHMMEVNPEFVRSMFRDLLNEQKELLLRLDRFSVHCHELMAAVEKKHGRQVSHFHDNHKILSVYLSKVYPMTYCIYDFPAFAKFAGLIGIQNIPQEYEVLRFFKIMRSLFKIISKDEELMSLQKKRLGAEQYSQANSLLLCHDFYFTLGSSEYNLV